MKKRKVVSLLLVAAMTMSAMTGCGAKTEEVSEEPVAEAGEIGANVQSVENAEEIAAMDESALSGTTISFWHSMGGTNGEAVDYLVNKFNEENEYGITVVAEYQGSYDDSLTKLKSAQMGNSGPDLVQVYEIGSRFMIDSGWIVPMQELIDADGFDTSVLEENVLAYYSIGDTLYSMPFNSSTPLLYYNKDMFEAAGITEAPTSFAEVEACGEKLTAAGCEQVISIYLDSWYFEQLTYKQGLELVNNGNGRDSYATEVSFDKNGAGINILNAWNSLHDKGYAPIVADATTDFVSGKAAMTFASTATLRQIIQDTDGKFEVGTAYLPTVDENSEGGVSLGGASLWALDHEDDAKKAATWKFVKFLVSAESQAYWNAHTGYFPINTEAQNEQEFKDNLEKYPQFQTALDQLHASSPEYVGALLSVFPESRVVVQTEIENMLNDLQTPEEALTKITEQMNSIIAEYNEINY